MPFLFLKNSTKSVPARPTFSDDWSLSSKDTFSPTSSFSSHTTTASNGTTPSWDSSSPPSHSSSSKKLPGKICNIRCGYLNVLTIVPGTYECQGATCQMRIKRNLAPFGVYHVTESEAGQAAARVKQPRQRQLIIAPAPDGPTIHDVSQIHHLTHRPRNEADLYAPMSLTPSISELREHYGANTAPSYSHTGHRSNAPLPLPKPRPMSPRKQRIMRDFGIEPSSRPPPLELSSSRPTSPSSLRSSTTTSSSSPRTPKSASSSMFSFISSSSKSSESSSRRSSHDSGFAESSRFEEQVPALPPNPAHYRPNQSHSTKHSSNTKGRSRSSDASRHPQQTHAMHSYHNPYGPQVPPLPSMPPKITSTRHVQPSPYTTSNPIYTKSSPNLVPDPPRAERQGRAPRRQRHT